MRKHARPVAMLAVAVAVFGWWIFIAVKFIDAGSIGVKHKPIKAVMLDLEVEVLTGQEVAARGWTEIEAGSEG